MTCPDCQGERLCAHHAWLRDAMIRVAGSERAEAFLRSLGAHPSREPHGDAEGVSGACGCGPEHRCPDHPVLSAPEPLRDDSAITWTGKCGSCGLALFKYGATWVCPTCDSIDLWPALEGESFYDQEADDA